MGRDSEVLNSRSEISTRVGVGTGVGPGWASPLVLRTFHPRDTGRPGQRSPKAKALLPGFRMVLGHIVTLTCEACP